MSQGPSMPTRGGRGPGWQWQRTGAPVGLAGVDGETSANATMEELLCVVQRETEEKARARTLASSSGSWSSSRFCLKSASASSLVPGATRRVVGKDQSSFASSAPTRRSSARTSHGEQASSGTPGREPNALAIARTGSVQQARAEQHEAARTRSGFGAMTRRSPGNIQDGDDCHAGLVELTCGKRPLDNSVDQSYKQWCCSRKNICPVPQDIIAARRFDQSTRSSFSTVEACSILMTPSGEQIECILQKFSGDSALQEQALQKIQLLAAITKGKQPCLERWSELLPILIDLQKSWKSRWTLNLEERRLTVILNLSAHSPNKEVLAGAMQLPYALKKIADMLHKFGSPVSPLVKVASIIANVSKFHIFRTRMLDIDGLQILRDLLKIEDDVVRREAVTGICGLCTNHKGMPGAVVYNMADALLESLVVTDKVLLMLDCLPKGPYLVDKICDKSVELVSIIMGKKGTELIIPGVTYAAISLVHAVVQRNTCKMEKVNQEDFIERLSKMLSEEVSAHTLYHLKEIIKILTVRFQAPTQMSGHLEEHEWSRPCHFNNPNKFVVRWSMKNYEISYPLHAEIIGEADPSITLRKEWDDIRVARKLRPLRDSDKRSSQNHYQMMHRDKNRMTNPIYMLILEDAKTHKKVGGFKIPEYLVCPLCGKVMVDPVTIATGETFDRECLRAWFNKNGHIYPIALDPVSSTVLRNERARGYLIEWRQAEREHRT